MYRSINLYNNDSLEPLLIPPVKNEYSKISCINKCILLFFSILSISQIIIGFIVYNNNNNTDFFDLWLICNGFNTSLICIEYLLINIKAKDTLLNKCCMCAMIINILILIGGIIIGISLYSTYSPNILLPTFIHGYTILIIFFELSIGFTCSRMLF